MNTDLPFAILFALAVGTFLIFWTFLSHAWISVLTVFTLTLMCVPVLLYAKQSLSFFFLCVYVFALPIDMSKAFVFEAAGEDIVRYVSLQDAILVLMILSLIFELVFKKKGLKLSCGTDLIVLFSLFLLWSSFSLIDSVKPHLGFLLITSSIKWMAVFVCVTNTLNTKRRVQIVLILLMLNVLFQSLYVAAQTQFKVLMTLQGVKPSEAGRYLYFGTPFKQLLRPAGTLHHPNVLATYLVYTLPLFFALFLAPFGWPFKAFVSFVFVGGATTLVLSFSRAGWLGFACAIFVIVAFALAWKMIRTKSLITIFFIGALSSVVLFPYWQSIVWRITKSDDKATHTRYLMMKQVFMMVMDKPITGIGLGNYAQASPRYVPENAHEFFFMDQGSAVVHNRYGAIAAETGLVGLAIYLWFLWRVLSYAFETIQIEDVYLKFLALGLFGSLIGLLPNMFFDHHGDDIRNTFFWFFVALMVSVRAQLLEEKSGRAISQQRFLQGSLS